MNLSTFKTLVAGIFAACLTNLSAQLPASNFTILPNPVCAGQTVQVNDLSTGNPTAWSYTLSGFGPNGAATSTVQNPVFVLNGQGTFSISLVASNASGSGAVVTHTLRVLPAPNVNVAPASQTTCIGGSVTSLSIVAGGGGGGNTAGLSYSWSTGSTTSVVSLPGQASSTLVSCVITGTNGCTTTRNASVTVAIPSASISSNPVNICPGTSSTLIATSAGAGPFSYTWSTAVNTRSTTAALAGVYNVTVTNGAGCTATQSLSLVTSSTLQLTILRSNTVVCAGNNLFMLATGASNYTWSTGALTNTVPVSPTVTTTYSVIGTIGTCSGSAVVIISVNVTPTITISSDVQQICAGKSATLSANGASTYTWIPGAIVQSTLLVNPTTITTYSVRGSNPGCPARTGTISISVIPSPSIQIIANGADICNGEQITLAAAGAQSYTWSTGNNSAIIASSPSVTTTYTLIGSGANGCSARALYTQVVNACADIREANYADKGSTMFPSPANEVVTLKVTNVSVVRVYNLQGELVFSKLALDNELQIQTSDLANGFYLVRIELGSGREEVTRLLVRH